MKELETISEAIERLNAQGYLDDFRAFQGSLKSASTQKIFRPEDLVVDEIFRFEGTTDLSDEAVVFALRDQKSGLRGTFTVAYGPEMDLLDSELVERLQKLKRR